MPLAQPPPMVRMGDGTYVPAQASFDGKPSLPKKFLVVVQYYEGDRAAAEELLTLIADLERVRSKVADVMVFSRADAGPIDHGVRAKLEAKFDRVFIQVCRRKGANTYPFASNEMFYDLVTLLGQYAPWRDDYFAFINLETDCVPLHPGWIQQLMEQFKYAKARGKDIIGDQQVNHALPHINGVAVYDTRIWHIVGSNTLNGGNPQTAYDMWHGPTLLPLSEDTPHIAFRYKLPSITPEDLFKAHKGGGVEPAIFHGVKDGSARAAVRARYVTFSDERETANRTVFTFFRSSGIIGSNEAQSILVLWRDAWISRGWNPVVLTAREAAQSAYADALKIAVGRFPGVAWPSDQFERWLALETVGGGFMVENDVVPARFTPANIVKDGTTLYAGVNSPDISAAKFLRQDIARWVQALVKFSPTSEDPVVTDRMIFDRAFADPIEGGRRPMVIPHGDLGSEASPMVQFSATAVRNGRKSLAIERFLQG